MGVAGTLMLWLFFPRRAGCGARSRARYPDIRRRGCGRSRPARPAAGSPAPSRNPECCVRAGCAPRGRRRSAVAEQAIEDLARIDFHRQRRGGRAPGNRVGVGAAEADVAGADQAGHVFGREFERRQRRVLADFLRRRSGRPWCPRERLRLRCAWGGRVEEDGRAAAVVAAAVARACEPAFLCARSLTTSTWSGTASAASRCAKARSPSLRPRESSWTSRAPCGM